MSGPKHQPAPVPSQLFIFGCFWLCQCCVIAWNCQKLSASGPEAVLRFDDVTSQSGITFRHDDGGCGKYYIVEAMSGGVALFDYDLDGDIDIYFLNGSPLCADQSPRLARNTLYRNDGNWRFTDVTDQAKVGDTGHGLGVTVGDYDNDGDPDLYINNFGPNVLYRNDRDGTFTECAAAAGVQNGNRVGAGTCFLDADGDGDLDLYAANYVRFSLRQHVPRTKQGYPIYGSPADYTPDADTLFRNNGDGTFSDVSQESGIAAHAAPGMGMACADFDRDGDTDIFVANDGMVNFLFQNDGRGKFHEIGLLSGFAYDMNGKVHASMGVDSADFDNDGFLDFHVTSFQGELATLYHNVRGRLLEDVSHRSGAGLATRSPVTWGNGFADLDNDGDRDLFIACGHLYDKLEHFDQATTYNTPNLLLQNLGDGTFTNVSDHAGPGMQVRLSSRGAGLDDLDNDGDIDVVVLNSRREPTLLRNDSRTNHHWIRVRLVGHRSNRDGVGSRVEVVAGNLIQVDEVHSGRGYQSHSGSILHFGLGPRSQVDQVRVDWLGGGTDTIANPPVDRVITISESAATTTSNYHTGTR